jgi:mono/diheme cytochrome c family protein
MRIAMLRLAFPITAASATLLLMVLVPRTARGQSSMGADSASPAAIDAGRKIFHGQGTCQACHGANLEGTPVGSNLQGQAWKDAKGGSYGAIAGVIRKGVSGTAMVSHPGGISDQDVQRVAAYVWAVSHGKAKP